MRKSDLEHLFHEREEWVIDENYLAKDNEQLLKKVFSSKKRTLLSSINKRKLSQLAQQNLFGKIKIEQIRCCEPKKKYKSSALKKDRND